MKQTDGALSVGNACIMHGFLRNFYFFERIFSINVLHVSLWAGWFGSLGRSGQHFAARFAGRFG